MKKSNNVKNQVRKNHIILMLWFFILSFSILVINIEAIGEIEQRAIDLETEASNLSLTWNKDNIQKSLSNFVKVAEIWKQLNQDDKVSSSFRKAGQLEIILGNKNSAKIYFEKSLSVIKNSNYDNEKSKILSELALLSLLGGENDKSFNYFTAALELAKKTNDSFSMAAAYFSSAEYYYAKNNLDEAITSLNKSILFYRQSDDKKGESQSLLSLGYVHLKKNNYKLTLNTFAKLGGRGSSFGLMNTAESADLFK